MQKSAGYIGVPEHISYVDAPCSAAYNDLLISISCTEKDVSRTKLISSIFFDILEPLEHRIGVHIKIMRKY